MPFEILNNFPWRACIYRAPSLYRIGMKVTSVQIGSSICICAIANADYLTCARGIQYNGSKAPTRSDVALYRCELAHVSVCIHFATFQFMGLCKQRRKWKLELA